MQVPGANRANNVRSAALSARARQLTPQATKERAAWHAAQRRPARVPAARLPDDHCASWPASRARRSDHRRRRPPQPARRRRRQPRRHPAPRRAPAPFGSLSADTSPRKSFYYGFRNPRLSYAIASDQPENDLRIDVVNGAGETSRASSANDVAPERADNVRWDGTLREPPGAATAATSSASAPSRRPGAAPPLPQGLRLDQRPPSASTSTATPSRSSAATTSALGARFGAARAGHTHQGQDVMATCGVPLVAARGGRVHYAGWEGAAGNYVVIDGNGTRFDTIYMHLADPPRCTPATPCAPASRSAWSAKPATLRLPPPLRAVDRAWLVRGRQSGRPAALPQEVGQAPAENKSHYLLASPGGLGDASA